MQKIIQTTEKVKGKYIAGKIVDLADREGADLCPICKETHRLRRHGFYERNCVLKEKYFSTKIRRLLCAKTGKTVSLLPDFLLPRKQHACSVIASFFYFRVFMGISLTSAILKATSISPSRQKGAFWIKMLLRNSKIIKVYLAGLFHRQKLVRDKNLYDTRRLKCRALLEPLSSGYNTLSEAFIYHNRKIHERLNTSLV